MSQSLNVPITKRPITKHPITKHSITKHPITKHPIILNIKQRLALCVTACFMTKLSLLTVARSRGDSSAILSKKFHHLANKFCYGFLCQIRVKTCFLVILFNSTQMLFRKNSFSNS